jgi:hypothetical protein
MQDPSLKLSMLFFLQNTIQHKRSQIHTYIHPYERTHTHPTPMRVFEDWVEKLIGWVFRLTKSPRTSRYRQVGWGCHYPPNHPTTGPIRAIVLLNPVNFEDQDLSFLDVPYKKGGSQAINRGLSSKLWTLKLTFGHIVHSVEGTSPRSLWKS